MDNYQSEDEKWNYIEDIYNAVCISLCTEYDCKLEKKTQDQWRYIESEKGVYFSASFFAGKKEFINSIVSDREKIMDNHGLFYKNVFILEITILLLLF